MHETRRDAGWVRPRIVAAVVASLVAAMAVAHPGVAQDATFVVTANRITGDAAVDDPATVPPCTESDCTLRAAVRAVNSASEGTITFETDPDALAIVAIQPNSLNVRGDLVVDGAERVGLTVDVEPEDAVATSQVFHVDRAVTLHLHDLFVGGSHATAGGAVWVSAEGAALRLDRTLFLGSSATTGDGGAILMAPGTTLDAVESGFQGNEAGDAGGAVFADGATVRLTDVDLVGNASSRGGALAAGGQGMIHLDAVVVGNNEAERGGGVEVVNAVLEISDSEFTGNLASRGGAIDVGELGSAAIAGTILTDNTAGDGAAVRVQEAAQATIDRSAIVANTADNVGAGILSKGSLELTNSRVEGNRFDLDTKGQRIGGGIVAEGPTVIAATTIAGNAARLGAGAALAHPQITVERSVVSGNDGDGLLVVAGSDTAPDEPVRVTNSTIHANTGHGVRVGMVVPSMGGDDVFAGRVSLTHVTITDNGDIGILPNAPSVATYSSSILAGNVTANCGGAGDLVSRGFNLEDADDCALVDTGDLVRTDPELGPLADNGGSGHGPDGEPGLSRVPAASSPAVDTADVRLCGTAPLDVDQRDAPRPQGDGCDRGAVEAPAPAPAEGLSRLFGPDRFETAAAVALQRFEPDDVDTVYLATGRDFPDALSGGPLAAADAAPILLATADAVPPATVEALETLSPTRVVALGGTGVLPQAVVEAAAAAAGGADTDRLAGDDRFATAAAVARATAGTDPEVIYLATGLDFPDALAGGPLAAADGAPILLATTDGLPDATADALADLAPETVVALGGTAVLSDAVLDAAAVAAGRAGSGRLSGVDRFATAARVAAALPGPVEVVYVATGLDFPDALTGVPAAAGEGAPILLTTRDAVPIPTAAHLDAIAALRRVVILGGMAAVGAAVEQDLAGRLP